MKILFFSKNFIFLIDTSQERVGILKHWNDDTQLYKAHKHTKGSGRMKILYFRLNNKASIKPLYQEVAHITIMLNKEQSIEKVMGDILRPNYQ